MLKEERGDQQRRRAERRPPRHPVPAVLATETVTLEPAPEEKPCPHGGREKQRIGEEVAEETDLIPPQLLRRRTVRSKYACPGGEAGVSIAPLPPRLIPQSKLGLGLAVHLLLARYDDHLSFYTRERIFRERSAVIYSILIRGRRRGLNPQEYLTDVLARLPSTKITQIPERLPAHWQPASANTS